MRVLCGEPEREHVGRGVVVAEDDPRLDRSRDQTRCADARADDGAGGGEGARHVAGRAAPVQDHVAGRLVVERRRALGGGRVDEGRQLVDLDGHPLGGVGRLLRRVGDDERDGLAHVADAPAREHRMRDGRELGALAADERERREALHLRCGQDRPDARTRPRGVRVDAEQAPVRVHAADEGGVEHPGQAQVADVLRLAAEEALVLGARQRPADPAACRELRHPPER